MKIYETGIIFDPQIEESQFDKEIEKVESLIKNNDGRIIDINRRGLRHLAYEIKKQQQGYYVFIVFEGNGTIPQKIEKSFLVNESVIRFMTVIADWFKEAPEEEETSPETTAS